MSKEFLDIQATIECRFTLKLLPDMIITYSQNNKFSGNNRLVYESYWDEIKQIFINSEMEIKNKGELSLHKGKQ